MNRVVLFTVFYPGAEPYENDFFESVANQTFKDFDLLIVNDGYKNNNFQVRYPQFNIIEIEGNNNISGNRAIGINYAIDQKYETLLLCDVDDYMTPMRVEESVKALKRVDLVVNDVDIVDANRSLIFKDYFQKSINEETKLNKDFVIDKNIFGFSNTALCVSKLSHVEFPTDLHIVDWYYITNLLNEGLSAKFIPKSLTEYRQHSGNMIGISSFTLESFKILLKYKIQHYNYFNDKYKGYDELLEKMKSLLLLTDNQLQTIIDKNTKETPYPMWWQNIRF